jgi:hypothetical protein
MADDRESRADQVRRAVLAAGGLERVVDRVWEGYADTSIPGRRAGIIEGMKTAMDELNSFSGEARGSARASSLRGSVERQSEARQRGDHHRVARCHAISAAADKGLLLPQMKGEASVPDLVAAATEHGLMAPEAPAKQVDPKQFRAALHAHGRTCKAEAARASTNGNSGLAERLTAIAEAALDRGVLLAPRPGDHHTVELVEAATALGLIESSPPE